MAQSHLVDILERIRKCGLVGEDVTGCGILGFKSSQQAQSLSVSPLLSPFFSPLCPSFPLLPPPLQLSDVRSQLLLQCHTYLPASAMLPTMMAMASP